MGRHFHQPFGYWEEHKPDRPWKEKKETLVWRGVTTGVRLGIIEAFVKKHGATGEQSPQTMGLFDIGFTALVQLKDQASREQELYQYLVREPQTFEEQLSHKYLLSIEGNDVASGLKWMLFSNSVVFMPIPTCVSWAMEELLLPWYHYVPIREDLMDLGEKILWCQAHDAECETISRHATQFMKDLWMSQQAKDDGEAVVQQIMEKYMAWYGHELHSCVFTTT
jgi:hypothetical protein